MKAENKVLLIIFGVVVTLMTVSWLTTFLVNIDFFKKPLVYNDEGCVRIKSFGSSEDQTKFNNNSVLMTEWNTIKYHPGEDRPGAVYVASGFQHSDATAKNTKEFVEKHLSIEKLPLVGFPEGVDFHPHGIFVHKSDNTLYVINHAYEKGGERIEVFDIVTEEENDDTAVPNELRYKYSITSDWMKKELDGTLNSLVVVEPNKFYVTQYHGHAEDRSLSDTQTDLKLLKLLMFRPKETCVWYCEYDSSLECRKVADGFIVANGITHNADFSKIFVADYLGRSIHVFERNDLNDLTNRVTVKFPHTSIDNIKYDDVSGKIYGGGITNVYHSFKNFALSPGEEKETSTSGLVELSYVPNLKKKRNHYRGWVIKNVLATSKLNVATNGIRMNSHYVMGCGVGFEGILVCPLVEDGKKQAAHKEDEKKQAAHKESPDL